MNQKLAQLINLSLNFIAIEDIKKDIASENRLSEKTIRQ